MSSNHLKTPLAASLNRFAEDKVRNAIEILGKALPCKVEAVNGAIVTVSFLVTTDFTLQNVDVPIAWPEYIRLPIQVGDTGAVFPADVPLTGIAGLGGPIAPPLAAPANLSTLLFFPVSSKAFQAVNPNYVVIYGVDGVQLQTKDESVTLTLTSSGVAIKGDSSIDGDLSVDGDISATGDIHADGDISADGDVTAGTVSLLHHVHSAVQTGGGTSGPPVP